jgi:nucleotide-binding universal stress UspA family protein
MLTLVSVEEIALVGAALSGYAAAVTVPFEGAALKALADAEQAAAHRHARVRTVPLEGPFEPALLGVLKERQADLVVLGTHETGRIAGILLGSKATMVLHDAPCSVFIARGDPDPEVWPRSIVVGVDGSPSSDTAYAAASALAVRFGADLEAVMSIYDHSDDEIKDAEERIPELRLDHDSTAVDALTEASRTADLVVVGSRGLRGLKALGSVSERVAHSAESSVLVVRKPNG